ELHGLLLGRLLLLLLLDVHERRVHFDRRVALAGVERRVHRGRDQHRMDRERHEPHPEGPLAVGSLPRLDQIVEHGRRCLPYALSPYQILYRGPAPLGAPDYKTVTAG